MFVATRGKRGPPHFFEARMSVHLQVSIRHRITLREYPRMFRKLEACWFKRKIEFDQEIPQTNPRYRGRKTHNSSRHKQPAASLHQQDDCQIRERTKDHSTNEDPKQNLGSLEIRRFLTVHIYKYLYKCISPKKIQQK